MKMKVGESLTESMKYVDVVIEGIRNVALYWLWVCFRLIWLLYWGGLNQKLWRTKGLLNLIEMRIVNDNENNDMLKSEFISGDSRLQSNCIFLYLTRT